MWAWLNVLVSYIEGQDTDVEKVYSNSVCLGNAFELGVHLKMWGKRFISEYTVRQTSGINELVNKNKQKRPKYIKMRWA